MLGHLPAEQAADVLSALPSMAGEVALRLTCMQPTDPKSYAASMRSSSATVTTENAAFTEVGGNQAVVNILNNVDRGTEKKIMSS